MSSLIRSVYSELFEKIMARLSERSLQSRLVLNLLQLVEFLILNGHSELYQMFNKEKYIFEKYSQYSEPDNDEALLGDAVKGVAFRLLELFANKEQYLELRKNNIKLKNRLNKKESQTNAPSTEGYGSDSYIPKLDINNSNSDIKPKVSANKISKPENQQQDKKDKEMYDFLGNMKISKDNYKKKGLAKPPQKRVAQDPANNINIDNDLI